MNTTASFSMAAGLILLLASTPLRSADFSLADSAFNRNGVVTTPGVPADVDDSLFDYVTGLGSITAVVGSGANFVGLFVDHEIDEAVNTFFNEHGEPVNTPDLIETWEIDEPGFAPPFGDIFDHFQASNGAGSALENASGVPSGSPNDVSMALGWNLVVPAGEHALVTFLLSDSAPTTGFYLHHVDPDSSAAIYFSSSVAIQVGVPDAGGAWALLLAGLAALRLMRRHLAKE
jgi:hypothetical protein